jgi:hypothetical protein
MAIDILAIACGKAVYEVQTISYPGPSAEQFGFGSVTLPDASFSPNHSRCCSTMEVLILLGVRKSDVFYEILAGL